MVIKKNMERRRHADQKSAARWSQKLATAAQVNYRRRRDRCWALPAASIRLKSITTNGAITLMICLKIGVGIDSAAKNLSGSHWTALMTSLVASGEKTRNATSNAVTGWPRSTEIELPSWCNDDISPSIFSFLKDFALLSKQIVVCSTLFYPCRCRRKSSKELPQKFQLSNYTLVDATLLSRTMDLTVVDKWRSSLVPLSQAVMRDEYHTAMWVHLYKNYSSNQDSIAVTVWWYQVDATILFSYTPPQNGFKKHKLACK